MNLVHNFPKYVSKIYYNIILSSTPRFSEWYLPFRFSNQNFVLISHLSHACYVPRQSYPPWFDRPNNILRTVQVMKLLAMQFSPASCPFLLCFSLNVSDQASRPCKTTGKIRDHTHHFHIKFKMVTFILAKWRDGGSATGVRFLHPLVPGTVC